LKERPGEASPQLLYGVHPVTEALESRPGAVERVFTSREGAPRLGRLLRQARQAGVPVTYLPRELLAKKLGGRAVHQGVAAQVAPIAYKDVDETCRRAARRQDGLLVVLDGVVDPGNLGAALRTCAAAGVDGVILGSEATVGLTPTVVKASAGSVERIPVAREPRLPARLRGLAEAGFLTVGLSPRGDLAWDELDLRGRIVFVAGGEQRGLRPGVRAGCGRLVSIPLASGVESLNVAVALGVILFEAARQRRAGSGRP